MTRFSVFLLPLLLLSAGAKTVTAQQVNDGSQEANDRLTEETLGRVLKSIGLKPAKTETRYDFTFKTSIEDEKWTFSMSTVLSRNEESVWVMAWLDQIPRTSGDVPRTALLRLLAANDRLGNGKFFAYIPTNKRFVLQRVVTNHEMTSRKLRGVLQDLAISVAAEYPVWATANWKPKKSQQQRVVSDSDSGRSVPRNPVDPNRSNRVRTSTKASKFDNRQVN